VRRPALHSKATNNNPAVQGGHERKTKPMNEILKLADQSAAQTDRWLFIATILTLFGFGITVLAYLSRRYWELLKESKADRDQYQSSLQKLIAEHTGANRKLIRCVEDNTRLLETCRVILAFFWENFRESVDFLGQARAQDREHRERNPSSSAKPALQLWKPRNAQTSEHAPHAAPSPEHHPKAKKITVAFNDPPAGA